MTLVRNVSEKDDQVRMIDWDKQDLRQPQPPPLQQQQYILQPHQNQNQNQNGGTGGGGGELFVKVMTDEQMELLRRQISVYATICEQLVEMHKNISAQQDLAGMRLGSLYCDPFITSGGHKITSRQRWTPTPVQLQVLEQIFDQGNGTPSKQKIKEITDDLAKHGQISETNVYNWFQNRRARSKRKQSVSATNNAESEVETEVESPREKKTKPENAQSLENLAPRENFYFQNPEIGVEMHCLDTQPNGGDPMFPSEQGLRSSSSLAQLSIFESGLPEPRMDQLIGKMEVPGTFGHYQSGEDYDIVG